MKHILTLFCIILTCTNLLSQSLKATVSNNNINVGGRFTLTFELQGTGGRLNVPDVSKDFRVLSGPNRSSSMQIINGSMSQSMSFSYILSATKEGEFTIGSASTTANGKTIKSDPIKITVSKSAGNNAASNQNSSTAKKSNDVFIRLTVNKTKVYQGEQITATYKIYTKGNIVDYEFNEVPSFNGFWTTDVDLGNVSLKPENVNGVQYYSAVIKKVILSPQRSGKIKLDPMKMDVTIRLQQQSSRRSIFDDFFGNFKDVKHSIASNISTVNVLPFPKNGKPESFNGAVGKFTISSNVSKEKVNVNDAVNFKVRIKGTGNLKLISEPKIEFPSDFEVYDPKVKEGSGFKEWEYVLIPRVGGSFEIPRVDFSFFNLSNKSYKSVSTNPISIQVEGSTGSSSAVVYQNNVSQKNIKNLSKDIRFIKTKQNDTININKLFFGSLAHILSLIFIPLAAVAIIVFYTYSKNQKNDTVNYRKKIANKQATKRLSEAKKQMESNNEKDFYEEVFTAIQGYLKDKFNIPQSQLSKETIRLKLALNNTNEQTINNTIKTLELCEMARFAPVNNENMSSVYEKSISIISNIEDNK